MYAKIRKSMFEGTLAGTGETWAVFVFLLVHSDPAGFVDMHPKTISLLTGFDEPRVVKALTELEAADFNSRSPEKQGARIVRVDEHRAWGWHITNYVKYRNDKDLQTIREQTNARVRKHRAKHACNATVTDSNALKRQEEVEVEVDSESKPTPTPRRAPRSAALFEVELPGCVSREVWRSFVEHRIAIKHPLTEQAAKLLLRRLTDFAANGHKPDELLEEAIVRGWRSVFEPKTQVASDGW